MNWLKKPPEEMTPEEAKTSRKSKKKKALSVLFFLLGMCLIFFIIFWLYKYNTTKTPTDSDVYSMEEATIGVPYAYDFSWMSGLLEPESSGPYTYYLGTMNGFPPMGLILGPDGILKGVPTPTGKSSTFEVCVKDTAGKFDCLKVSLEVYTAATKSCPANSHFESSSDSSKCLCDTGYKKNSAGNGCVRASAPTPPKNTGAVDNTCESFAVSSCGNIIPGDGTTPNASFAGGPVFDYCSCPKGEHFTGQIIPMRKEFWDELPAGYHGNHTFKMCDCDGQ